jgi:hypothetical protein
MVAPRAPSLSGAASAWIEMNRFGAHSAGDVVAVVEARG